MDFKDKKVLITGASRGIGFATAQEFLALGARVAINGRSEQSVATAIAYLASDDARFITGVALPMDGGSSAGS
jgi:NAD(P)-dependent dehydrogenase (short-subunit alcohol dehydrogenase family)